MNGFGNPYEHKKHGSLRNVTLPAFSDFAVVTLTLPDGVRSPVRVRHSLFDSF